MSKRLRRTLVLIGFAAAAVALFIWLSRPQPVLVRVQAVDRGDVEATVANTRAGTVKACRRARLSPATGGQIASLPVTEGDRVEPGQLLLELWNEDLAASLMLAEREEAAAKARAEEACVAAQTSKREADRLTRLREQRLASEEDTDRAVGDARARAAACRAGRALVRVSSANIDVARAALERTLLHAPFAGTVAEVNGELGEFVTPSPVGIPTPPAVDLIDNSCLYITAPIDEVDAPAIRANMPARITLDAFADRAFPATVRRVAPYALDLEKQARTVEVEADITDPSDVGQLLPGYSADLEVILAVRPDVLRVPTQAVLEGDRLMVYDPAEGILQEREIEPGVANWEFTEVVSGVSTGELIVTSVDREGVEPGVLAAVD